MDIGGVNRSGPAAPASVPTAPVEANTQNREVIQAVKALNASEMFGDHNELQFQKDPQTQRMVVRMVDRKTKEVMSQIPPEYVLELAAQSKPPRI
jgi:flagellar protein FlaG